MNEEEKDLYTSTICQYNEQEKASKMLITALKEIAPIKGSRFSFAISLILAIISAIYIGTAENTIDLSRSIVEMLLTTLLTIFGFIFAVYSILLAFLSDTYIKQLVKVQDSKGNSYLKMTTTYYESALFLYLAALGITGVLLLFLKCIEPDFILTSNWIFNNILASVFLGLYFTFVFRVLYELKSTIYNTVILFRESMAFRLIVFAKEKEGQSNDNDK